MNGTGRRILDFDELATSLEKENGSWGQETAPVQSPMGHHMDSTTELLRGGERTIFDDFEGTKRWGYSLIMPEDRCGHQAAGHEAHGHKKWGHSQMETSLAEVQCPFWSEESQDIIPGLTSDGIQRTPYQVCMPEETPELNSVHQFAEPPKHAELSAFHSRMTPLVESKYMGPNLTSVNYLNGNDEIVCQLEHESQDPQLISHCRSSLTLHSWLGDSLDPTLTAESFGLSMKDDLQQTAILSYPLDSVLVNSPAQIEDEEYNEANHKPQQAVPLVGAPSAMHLPAAHQDFHAPAGNSQSRGEKKKSLRVIRWLICGCAAGTVTDITDKGVLGIVESSKCISRCDSDESTDSNLLDTPRGHRGARYLNTNKSKLELNGERCSKSRGKWPVFDNSPRSESNRESGVTKKVVQMNPKTNSSGLRKIVWMSVTPPAKFQLTDTEWALFWKFNGYWTLDRKLSDNKEWSLAHVWQLSRLMRQAIDKLDLLVIDSTPKICRTSFSSSETKELQEQRPWGGEIVRSLRRDCRQGIMMSWVERNSTGFTVRMEWGDPFPAHSTETFELSRDGQMLLAVQEVCRRDKPVIKAQIRTIYQRLA